MPINLDDETRNSLDGSAQATLISGVCNSILLFCGLLIAGTFTVVTSSRFNFDNIVLVAAIVCVFGLSFFAGIIALIGIMKAHNLARRAERFRLGLDAGRQRIDSARRHSVLLSVAAFYLTIAASLAAFAVVAIYLFQRNLPESSQLNGITIVKSAGTTTITVGKALQTIQMGHDGKVCKTVVPIDGGQITIDSAC
ncbi:hypothetical protein IB238_20270 [Rhizobium sp. ARZ01]|uniref:hypothetical protein n=1 Tax=Rhizobium sp. ARZ01 TaxID=2769313 RepID=UPI00177F70A7|nr:hypothetical protein [Rhizobium sp. ARZ01]MBD9374966.1 hypothetical protein [Rhizobium sp. ARZ01]